MLQSKARLERTKKTLQLGTASYIVLLLLMSIFDKIDLAMVVQLGAIGLGLTACGSGAAKVSIGQHIRKNRSALGGKTPVHK